MNISLGGVLVALLFVVPGYLFATARRMMAIQVRGSEFEFVLQAIIWSVTIYAISGLAVFIAIPGVISQTLATLDALSTVSLSAAARKTADLFDLAWRTGLLWAMSWALGLGMGYADRRHWTWLIPQKLGRSRLNRYVTEFDSFFEQDPSWVIVCLKDDTLIQAPWASATISPMSPEVQLRSPIYFGSDGEFVLLENWNSMYIPGSEIRYMAAVADRITFSSEVGAVPAASPAPRPDADRSSFPPAATAAPAPSIPQPGEPLCSRTCPPEQSTFPTSQPSSASS